MVSKSAKGKRGGKGRTGDAAPAFVGEGDCWAVPVPGLGFCPLIVGRAPRANADVDFAFAYLNPALSARLPRPQDVGPVESWRSAWIGLVPTLPMRKARWTHCGVLPGFDRAEWPVPPGRASAVDEREPVEQWEQRPGGELWSIETTVDEPSMTLIANTPATRAEALRFPRIGVATAASGLEKALATHLKGRQPGFWDMPLYLQRVRPGSIKLWREYSERVRASWPPDSVPWLPAGRRTDRNLKPGTWMGLPLAGGGFGAAMLVARPELHQRCFADAVVMAMRRRWDRWPTLAELVALQPEDGAIVAQTSMICARDGRWRVLGDHPGFDPEKWVWPLPWCEDSPRSGAGIVAVAVDSGKSVAVRVDPAVLRLDPLAGRRCGGSCSYGKIELDVPHILSGTHPAEDASVCPDGVVTPERLAAWRRINAEIRRALA